MKKIKRLSLHKKKNLEYEEAENITNIDRSCTHNHHSTKKKFFSKKRFQRSKSLPEKPPEVVEASLNIPFQNGYASPATILETVDANAPPNVATPAQQVNPCSPPTQPLGNDQYTAKKTIDKSNDIEVVPNKSSRNNDANNEENLCSNNDQEAILARNNPIDYCSSHECNELSSLNVDYGTDNQTESEQKTKPEAPSSFVPSYMLYQHKLIREFKRLALQGWYWGPLSRIEAEEKLYDTPDGSFLVRDSASERYLLSLSFRSFGRTLHTRIEHTNGKFSFYSDNDAQIYTSVVDLIEESVRDSQYSGVFCYSRSPAPQSPTLPVRLTHPISRLSQVRSLQYLCRFVIRQYTTIDRIQDLPLPNSIKGYVNQPYF